MLEAQRAVTVPCRIYVALLLRELMLRNVSASRVYKCNFACFDDHLHGHIHYVCGLHYHAG